MNLEIGEELQVDSLKELPSLPDELKFFACIGGMKNYQCFLETKKLSRAEFMMKYQNQMDKCHIPIYEDNEIIVRQDAQIPIPGFYIVATKQMRKKISSMDLKLYIKSIKYSAVLKKKLQSDFGIKRVFMYYDEQYNKPSSTHFWVMPIYEEVLLKNNLNATILNEDIWKYQELFEFKSYKKNIYRINNDMKELLKFYKE
jgi:hypothetical protein